MSDAQVLRFPLGSARSSFVSTVGRKIIGIRALVPKLGNNDSPFARNELKLRLLDLRAGARSMHASALEEALNELCADLETMLAHPHIADTALQQLDERLDALPKLAWGKTDILHAPNESSLQALVLGPAELAMPLGTHLGGRGFYSVDVEAPTKPSLATAIALSPDVIVLDADEVDNTDIAEELLSHPHTESIPLVVVGTFDEPSAESAYVALGVARTLKKPLTPDAFRRAVDACVGLVDVNRPDSGDYGAPTLPMLADRLAREVYHALNDVAGERDRSTPIPLGQGSDVTAALWGAIARIQEMVSARTGARFRTRGPAGSIALAAAMESEAAPGAQRLRGQRGNTTAVDLKDRKVLIVDDDPAVVWFLADILKDAGCKVLEATSGAAALALAERECPELILADIVMPGLDGVLLSRALKRDVVLRDVPVCLLSWKEDLLTRVRELGVNAAGYLRKETDAVAVVARVKEALRPRARIEERLLGEGEIRGRLDGFTVGSLIAMANKTRPNARISLREGRYLHELELRDGVPVKAVRVDADGHLLTGHTALTAMSGVFAGRFTVATSAAPVDSEFGGENFTTLMHAEFVSRRALTKTYASAALNELSQVTIDAERAKDFARDCTPQSASIIHALCSGITLADLAMSTGDEDQLSDLIAVLVTRGIVLRIADRQGRDLALRETSALGVVLQRATRDETPAFGATTDPVFVRANESTSVQAAPVAPLGAAATKIDHTLYGAATANRNSITNHMQDADSATPAAEELSHSIRVDLDVTPSGVAHSATSSVAPVAAELGATTDTTLGASAKRRFSVAQRRMATAAAALALVAAFGFAATARTGATAAGGAPEAQPATTASEVATGEARADQGILVVTQAAGAPMRVDGVVRGDGQAVRLALVAGKHTVSREGGHSVAAIEITAGKVTRIDLKAE